MTEKDGVGLRLRAIRRVFGMGTVTQAAKGLGVKRSRWSMWETGGAEPPPGAMVALRRRWPQVDLNYLYGGLTTSVMPQLANQLRAEEAAILHKQGGLL